MFVIITPEIFAEDEAELLTKFVLHPNVFVHIRKPNATESQLTNYLQSLSTTVIRRSSLHSYHHLVTQFNARGVHFTTAYREALGIKLEKTVDHWKSKGKKVSTSLHDLQEISSVWDYAFLSPVFDSISKKNYRGKQFRVTEKKEQLIGLGGITTFNMKEAQQLGYHGVAVLGSIWHSNQPLKAFEDLYHQYSLYFQQPQL